MKKKETNPQFKEMVEAFSVFYFMKKEIKFAWSEKEFAAINMIFRKIRLVNSSNVPVIDFFKTILERIPENSWYMENLSPAIINSKFNEVLSTIRKNCKSYYSELKSNIVKNMVNNG